METLLAGLGWCFGFIGFGIMLSMNNLIDAFRDIGIARTKSGK